jgi:hypothetical protein
MRGFTFVVLAAVAGIGFAITPKAEANVEIGVAAPERGEKAEPSKRVDSAHFQGNEARD